MLFRVMSCLAINIISRTLPSSLPRYECNRGIKFLRNIFKKRSVIRIPSDFNIKEYKVFYTFPQIAGFATQVRYNYTKLGVITVSVLPSIYYYYKGELNIIFLNAYCVGAFTLMLLTMYMGYIGKNLIGKMYLHKDMKDLIISYVNINGRRMNKSYKLDDIEIVDHPNILFKKFFKKGKISINKRRETSDSVSVREILSVRKLKEQLLRMNVYLKAFVRKYWLVPVIISVGCYCNSELEKYYDSQMTLFRDKSALYGSVKAEGEPPSW